MVMTKTQQTERADAIAALQKVLEPGDTLYTTLVYVSRSGMMRVIDVFVIRDNIPLRLSWSAALASGHSYNRKHEGVQADGCGVDMGFEIVCSLSRSLFPRGFPCIGKGTERGSSCPSNDHSNGDRDYTPHSGDAQHLDGAPDHWHCDGGYALRHRWM
jgi:hypothetical protein